MELDDMPKLGLAGFVLGLVGALLVLVTSLERLLSAGPWPEPLVLGLVAGLGLLATFGVSRSFEALGSIVMLVTGIVIAVIGPTSEGVLLLVGGVLVFASMQDVEPETYEGEDVGPGTAGP